MHGWNQGANNLATALMRRPALQARGQRVQAEADLAGARMGETTARTRLLDTQGDRANLQLAQAMQLAEALQQSGAVTQDADGNTVISKEAAPAILSHVAGMGTGANDSAGAIGNIMTALNKVPQAGLERKSKADISAASDKVRGARPVVGGSGSTIFAPDGTPLAQAAATVAPGGTRLAPAAGTDLPAAEASGQPLPPKSSEVQGILARTIAQVTANKDLDAKTKMATIAAVKAQLSNLEPGASASPPPTAVTAPAPSAPAPAAPQSANEVQRQTKDGRIAIFDGNTKQFLRYAN